MADAAQQMLDGAFASLKALDELQRQALRRHVERACSEIAKRNLADFDAGLLSAVDALESELSPILEDIDAGLSHAFARAVPPYYERINRQNFGDPEGTGTDSRLVRLRDSIHKLCANNAVDGLRQFIGDEILARTRECNVGTILDSQVFQYQPMSKKWFSQTTADVGPEGVCGIIDLSTLYLDPKLEPERAKSRQRWVYETRRIVANPEGQPCKNFSEHTSRYEHRSFEDKPLDCQYFRP